MNAYDDYIARNWKPNIKRVAPVSGCNCASCQLHRQLRNEWDKNIQQALEFKRYLELTRELQRQEDRTTLAQMDDANSEPPEEQQ